jgi:hypothetical protein
MASRSCRISGVCVVVLLLHLGLVAGQGGHETIDAVLH